MGPNYIFLLARLVSYIPTENKYLHTSQALIVVVVVVVEVLLVVVGYGVVVASSHSL